MPDWLPLNYSVHELDSEQETDGVEEEEEFNFFNLGRVNAGKPVNEHV